ncbi:MAG: hypothetical protein H6858_09875 [Rhodospirillales bacterium]|nr:hypothetical protein [Alphaproteobacteria bacterium]MCB1840143.1 hypothetical protein [Alphaproteobacteria bacterium]MCB9977894.1 hypothetical protein [Rhodospirillales bacterium]
MGEDMTIDALLQQRHVPEMRRHLSARIIDAAMKHPQAGAQTIEKSSFSFKGWWADFWDGFALPQPALVMSLVLLLGILAGTKFDFDLSDTDQDRPSYELVVSDGTDLEALL